MVKVKTYTLLMSAMKQAGLASITAIAGAVNDCTAMLLIAILLFSSGMATTLKALYTLIFR